jgi:hypothetical protein
MLDQRARRARAGRGQANADCGASDTALAELYDRCTPGRHALSQERREPFQLYGMGCEHEHIGLRGGCRHAREHNGPRASGVGSKA